MSDETPSREPPILAEKHYAAPSVFDVANLMREARRQKRLPAGDVPPFCVLDPDGDLVDYLRASGQARPHPAWACYHTTLNVFDLDGMPVGIVGRAVGASFAVLVAEELFVSGCQLLISVTSAGQITPLGPTPYFVLIERALRDEGTSYHYLPPARYSTLAPSLREQLNQSWEYQRVPRYAGSSWTTDAPFRETPQAIAMARAEGIAAVEMEAAALYALATAKGYPIVCFAHVTNTMATQGDDFEKGPDQGSLATLAVIAETLRCWQNSSIPIFQTFNTTDERGGALVRLHEVERGDGPFWPLLIRLISLMSGMRLPDAARIVFYHKAFFGDPMGLWTHTAMRGESAWTVAERELMAAMTAAWNGCSFCISAHSAIAARVLGKPLVETALADFQRADLPARLQATLSFLKTLTQTPDTLAAEQAQAVLRAGVTSEALEDAIAVSVLFNITSRCADALDYEMLDANGFDRAAKRLLEQGYAFGKGKRPAHPDHRALAEALRQRTLEGPGETDANLRQAIAERAAGGPPVAAPYDDLARQIGEAAYKLTDVQVAKVVEQVGSERAAFELIVASALGAGLYRWQRGMEMLDEAVR